MTDLVTAKVAGAVAASAVAGIVCVISDSVANTAITQIGLVLMAAVAAYFAYRAKTTAEDTKRVAEKTHDDVNSRMEKFLKVVEEKYFAEGKLEAIREAKIISDAADRAKAEAKVISDAAEKVKLEAKPKLVESAEGLVKVISETTKENRVP